MAEEPLNESDFLLPGPAHRSLTLELERAFDFENLLRQLPSFTEQVEEVARPTLYTGGIARLVDIGKFLA